MAKISTDAEINSIRLKEQASAPDTPSSGYLQVYTKADGALYTKNDAGEEYLLMVNPLTAEGDLLYGGASGFPTRLAAGTEDYILTMGATTPEWAEASGGSGLDANGWESADAMTYASADDPTFTMTCSGDQTSKYSAGMRVKLSQTTVKYFIITAVSYSDPNTTITLYGGTDYDLANAEIADPYYSVVKAPQGFPLSPNKWKVEVTDTTERTQNTPTQNTWYNAGSITITIPIGSWRVGYFAGYYLIEPSAVAGGKMTLSTANNSESDEDFTCHQIGYFSTLTLMHKEKFLDLSAKTAYYLNIMTSAENVDSIAIRSDRTKTIIRAVCAYL